MVWVAFWFGDLHGIALVSQDQEPVTASDARATFTFEVSDAGFIQADMSVLVIHDSSLDFEEVFRLLTQCGARGTQMAQPYFSELKHRFRPVGGGVGQRVYTTMDDDACVRTRLTCFEQTSWSFITIVSHGAA